MKRRNIYALLFFMAMVFAVSGCAQLRDKFIRKPKEEEVTARRYRVVRKYDVHPSLELYTKRYIFWKNWHEELLFVLGGTSHKKEIVAVEQDVSNLMDMQSMLVDEKAEQLQKIIEEMEEIERKLKKEKVTPGNEVRIRKKLESLGREIRRQFSYNKMRGFIRSDFRKGHGS